MECNVATVVVRGWGGPLQRGASVTDRPPGPRQPPSDLRAQRTRPGGPPGDVCHSTVQPHLSTRYTGVGRGCWWNEAGVATYTTSSYRTTDLSLLPLNCSRNLTCVGNIIRRTISRTGGREFWISPRSPKKTAVQTVGVCGRSYASTYLLLYTTRQTGLPSNLLYFGCQQLHISQSLTALLGRAAGTPSDGLVAIRESQTGCDILHHQWWIQDYLEGAVTCS